MTSKTASRTLSVLAVLAVLWAPSATAQNQDWTWEVTLAATATNFLGTSESNGVQGDIRRDFGEILDELEIGGMAAVVGDFGTFSLLADAWQVEVESAETDPPARVTLENSIFEVDAGWEFRPGIDLLVGARSYSVDNDLFAITPEGTFASTGDDSWVDPIVGIRVHSAAGDRWSFSGRAAVGGFGVGSDFTWDVMSFFVFDLSDSIGLGLGYRVLDVDFEEGEVIGERFRHDVTLTALMGGVQFHF